ncbi:MAG: hypothetical protein HZA16_15415 [Nitrospirae bacterium]|nr:hypothetical protein [Nitrospirota bacterium]
MTMKRACLLLFSIVFLLSGCAANQGMKGEQANAIKNRLALAPAGSHEECVVLKKGQVMVYKFISSKPVDFNIHYHSKGDVQYPVSKNEITEYDGTFDPEKSRIDVPDEETFCMMWENQDMRQLSLSYECVVRNR